MNGRSNKRVVAGTIDAGGVYYSRVAAGGGFAFLGGTALDESGAIAKAARPGAPYEFSASAQARAEAQYLFAQWREALPKVGAEIKDVVQLEQYVKRKLAADAYFGEIIAPEILGAARPGAATAQLRGFFPEEAVINVTGLAIVPDEAAGWVKGYPGVDPTKLSATRIFTDVITAGPYVCTTYFPTDNKTGVDPAVLTESWNWRGSEIRSEAEYGIETIKGKLARVGASLTDIVDYTLFLTDVGDLYEFDVALKKAIGDVAPTRTVIPTRGYAVPRREDAFGHAENAPRMEAQFRCLIPDSGLKKEAVDGPGAGFGYQSAAVKVGQLLWISSQVADNEQLGGSTARQLDNIVEKIATTCRNGGTKLANLLRLRALVTDPADAMAVFAAVKKAIPSDPPTVCINVVDGPLLVSGATVALDAVAFVEGA